MNLFDILGPVMVGPKAVLILRERSGSVIFQENYFRTMW